jgi:spermidine export protein MdtI
MPEANLIHLIWLLVAIVIEILANIFLKMSNGFKKPIPGLLSIVAVIGAFSALSQAVKGIDLSIAYALWGGFGIVATMVAGKLLFGQHINRKGIVGLLLLLFGMVLIKFA